MLCLNKKSWKNLSKSFLVSFILSCLIVSLLYFATKNTSAMEENSAGIKKEQAFPKPRKSENIHETAILEYVDTNEGKVVKSEIIDEPEGDVITEKLENEKNLLVEDEKSEQDLDKSIEKAENWADDEIIVMNDGELILETTIQDYLEEDFMYAINKKDVVYLSLSQFANFVGIMYENKNDTVISYYSNKKDFLYEIDLKNHTAKAGKQNVEMKASDYKNFEDTMFFSTDFLARLYGVEIKYDLSDMTLKIDREQEFPTMVKRNATNRRNKRKLYQPKDKGFAGYETDERLFGLPVFDLSVSKGWSRSSEGKSTNSDSYSLSLSTIAMGLDVNAYVSGDFTSGDKPDVRISGGRTLLNEPKNKLNLKEFEIGDISGINSTYFVSSNYGRGITASSFKDLVMSADKTIDIVGPLPEGWEVELYWNGQLIGYRQNSIAGEYNFPAVPVSYGLNTFKLVFFGPYGETYTEEKRYYSGTSPVKKGEIGYNIAIYQPERYLIENENTPDYDGKDIPVIDSTFYYGATDNITLMGGLTQTPDAKENEETQHFAMAGVQYVLSGVTLQYNLENNIDTAKTGHHFEAQGDIYFGTIYAMYDRYDELHSPLSYYGDEYLKDKTEFRLNGGLFGVPYYISYRMGRKEEGDIPYENIVGRISKNVSKGWYLSLEDNYDVIEHENEIKPSIYTYWGNYSLTFDSTYRTNPNAEFTDVSARFSYRQDRYTYYNAQYRRDLVEHMDYYSVSGSRVFDFGGLSLSLQVDKKGNFSSYLTYNVSFSKEPDKLDLIASGYSSLGNAGSVYVKLEDDAGNPLEGVGIKANNMVKEQYTDEDGTVFITDLVANEKTDLVVDMETLEDISLKPDNEITKLVLRPGTIREVDVIFKHYGSIEGQIANKEGKRLYGYRVAAINDEGKEVASSFTDLYGYFVVPDVPYGKVNLIVYKENTKLAEVKNIKVDDLYISLDNEIEAK